MQDESSRSTGLTSLDSTTCEAPVPTTSRDVMFLRSDFHARTSALPTLEEPEPASRARNRDSGLRRYESREDSGQIGFWSKTSPERGETGCPSCGATSGDWGMPACRFSCAPRILEPRMGVSESSLLPTPTATANQCAPSMRKHPACRRLQALTGTGGRPHPEVFAWMMGFPQGWAVTNSEDMGMP